jgi:single-stranded DNA-specific DHH superfamily exonuclease
MLSKSKFDQQEKQDIFQYFIPYAAIATVADCVPLTNENRLIVKQ